MIGAALALVAACLVVFIGATLRHERALTGDDPQDPTPRVLAFELAGSGRTMYGLLAGLGEDGRTRMRRALVIDRWMIAGYAPGLAVLCLVGGWFIGEISTGTVELIGIVLAVIMALASLGAGAFDLRENRGIARCLDLWPADPVVVEAGERMAVARERRRRELIARLESPSGATRRASTGKFVLLGVVILGWLPAVFWIWVTHAAH